MTFKEFCGGDLWNIKFTWDTDYPRFTKCFLKTLNCWIPCIFLILASFPYYFSYLRHLPTLEKSNFLFRRNRVSRLHVAKFSIGSVILVLESFILLYSTVKFSEKKKDYVLADVTTPLICILSFAISVALMEVERKKRLVTSGVHFFFYFLLSVSALFSIISLISYGILGANETYDLKTGISLLLSCLYVVQLVLFSLAEKQHYDSIPPSSFAKENRPPCPENRASFVSRLFFHWIKGIVHQGYKKTLEQSDLFDLNPRDMSASNAARLEQEWKYEVIMCQKENEQVQMEEGEAWWYKQNADLHELPDLDPLLPPEMEIPVVRPPKLKTPSLFKALFRAFGAKLILSHFIKIFCDCLLLSGPLIQSLVIGFIDSSSSHAWQGYFFGLLFFLNSVTYTILFQWVFHIGMNIGMRVNAAVVSLVYKKALTMDMDSKRQSTVGEIVNLMSVDAQRMQDATAYLWMLWSSPLQVVLSLTLLWKYLGASILTGMAVMLVLIPINVVVAGVQKKLQIKQMNKKDERIRLLNEILNGIKVLKLNAWEESLEERVLAIRNSELSTIKKFCYLAAVLTFSWSCAPFLVTLATFATYVWTGGVLDARKAFTALSLFNILRVPISLLPMVVTFIVMATVSMKRINKFLLTSDLDPLAVIKMSSNEAIKMEGASFAWSKNKMEEAVLKNLNFSIEKGSLTAVVGRVGVGKTSLISAILGDMNKISGSVLIDGKVAYVSQQAWIQNATLRDNILFGKPFDPIKYHRILEACAMVRDLEILQGGDQTEIGEKGINLSGGQKQRVNLARALYQECDLYLLDDPLSAVDSHVAKHIFKQVVGPQGFLRNKTRVLVTHGITWLTKCDKVVVMNQGGVIGEMGPYKELLEKSEKFGAFIRENLTEEKEEERERLLSGQYSEEEEDDYEGAYEGDGDFLNMSAETTEDSLTSTLKSTQEVLMQRMTSGMSDGSEHMITSNLGTLRTSPSSPQETIPLLSQNISAVQKRRSLSVKDEEKLARENKIITEEFAQIGQVSLGVYWTYIKSLSISLSFIFVLAFFLFQVASLLSNFCLSQWTNTISLWRSKNANDSVNDDITSNTSGTSSTEEKECYNHQLYYLGLYGGYGLMQAVFILIYALVAAQANVNSSLRLHKNLLYAVLRAPMSFFDTTPIGRILNRFSKDIEIVDNNLITTIKSWLNNFTNIIFTVVVISINTPVFLVVVVPVLILYYFLQRFYMPTTRQLKRLESTTKSPIYNHFSESISGASVIRAFDAQQQFIKRSQYLVDHNMTIYFANITSNRWLAVILDSMGGFIVFAATVFSVLSRDTLNSSVVGLSISYALQITFSLTWLVRMGTQLETNVVSVERIIEYSRTSPEADRHQGKIEVPVSWPTRGHLEFKGYGLRYRPNLDLVLKNINLSFRPGEKIGIVGRTGAGKSSITLALFRIIEAATGKISIDGVDISQLPLYKLRTSITILPQDPVLFSGSLRSNLDPTEMCSDAEIWSALELCHLKDFVQKTPHNLYHECGEGGENLSVGQRQLMCLGRTLLRKTKILVLDEATAAVDLETDKVIQETIRGQFEDCTILIIAHRINTILSCDRVMVMDTGEVKEIDSPSRLLSNPSSLFYSLAKDAGVVQ